MIGEGTVSADLEAVVSIRLRGPRGAVRAMEVVDTGFNGFLCLPRDRIGDLELEFVGETEVTLADGHTAHLSVFDARVLFGVDFRSIDALQADGAPLVGMSLLLGNRLTIDVLGGGTVSVRPIV